MPYCQCCNEHYPLEQMVRKDRNELLYIVHAIEAYGLFLEPKLLRELITIGGITNPLYLLPDEKVDDLPIDDEESFDFQVLPSNYGSYAVIYRKPEVA